MRYLSAGAHTVYRMSDPTTEPGPLELTDLERGILDLERLWFQYPGRKEAVVRERFDLSMTRYHQLVNALIDTEAALAHDPLLVKRLRRIRSSRSRTRSARRMGVDL